MSEILEKQFTLGDIVLATEPIGEEGELFEPQSNNLLPVVSGTQTNILKQVFDSEYSDIKLNHQDAKRIAKSIGQLRNNGSAGVRLTCMGDNCEYNASCELYKTKVAAAVSVRDPNTGQTKTTQQTLAPVGKPCPLEALVVNDAKLRYVEQFNDLYPDNDSRVIDGYINDLCQIESLTWRCNMLLGYDISGMTVQTPGAVTSDGRVVWKLELNPILELLERLQGRKTRILNDLVKTPREKYKKEHAVGNKEGDSLARQQAAARARLKNASQRALPDHIDVPDHLKK